MFSGRNGWLLVIVSNDLKLSALAGRLVGRVHIAVGVEVDCPANR